MNRLLYLPLYFISILPFPFLYFLSDCVYFLFYYLLQYRKKIVRINLENSFPLLSPSELKTIEQEFYHHFCDVLFEAIKALTISKKTILKRFKITNPEMLERFYLENRSIMLYTAHMGNWEWLSFIPHYTRFATSTFYQPLSNKYINKLMFHIRSQFGTHCIPSKQGYKELLRFKNEGVLSLNCLIGDQSPKHNSQRHTATFMNQETDFMVGGDRIATKLKQAVLYPEIIKPKRGHYELTFKVIEERPTHEEKNKCINAYIDLLEQNIMKQPALWLWSHRRWKDKHQYI